MLATGPIFHFPPLPVDSSRPLQLWTTIANELPTLTPPPRPVRTRKTPERGSRRGGHGCAGPATPHAPGVPGRLRRPVGRGARHWWWVRRAAPDCGGFRATFHVWRRGFGGSEVRESVHPCWIICAQIWILEFKPPGEEAGGCYVFVMCREREGDISFFGKMPDKCQRSHFGRTLGGICSGHFKPNQKAVTFSWTIPLLG